MLYKMSSYKVVPTTSPTPRISSGMSGHLVGFYIVEVDGNPIPTCTADTCLVGTQKTTSALIMGARCSTEQGLKDPLHSTHKEQHDDSFTRQESTRDWQRRTD